MLYFVPTPVGNLDDITIRALKLFEKAETVICEDPRVISNLLKLLEIKNKPSFINIVKNHNFNESTIKQTLEGLAKNQKEGVEEKEEERIILVTTDAGTPGISDPGLEIVKIAKNLDLKYTVLPGATAFVPAVVASGLVNKEFVFLGFLPTKKGRQTAWKVIKEQVFPVVLYESVHRIEKFVEEAQIQLEPDRKIFFTREISKKFEEFWSGEAKDLKNFDFKQKGEFVVVIGN